MSRIICVTSGKGGVGKTTVSINLAAALASQFKKKTVVVDLNLTTSHIGTTLGMHYCPENIAKVLSGKTALEDAVFDHKQSGMKVVPGSMRLADIHGLDFARLRPALKALAEKSEYVIVDSGPGFGIESMAAIKYSDELLYVTTPFVPAVMDLVRCEEAAKQFQKKSLGVVVNMIDEEEHQLSEGEVNSLTGLEVISQVPRDVNVSKSLSQEMPIVIYDPQSPASQEFIALAGRITGEKFERKKPGVLHHFTKKIKKAALKALR